MTLDSIEIPMPGTIAIFTPDGTEYRVMRAEMTAEGLRMEIAPVVAVEQDPESGRWYRLDAEGDRLHGPYLSEMEARGA